MVKTILPDMDSGHHLAEAIYQRNKVIGQYKSVLDDSSKEEDIATGIYRIVSSQKIPIKDAGSLIEKVLREHKCEHFLIKGERVPLSKARNLLSDIAIYLLSKHDLPIEPAENSGIMTRQ